MADKNKEHGPHGPNCTCSPDDEIVAAGIALSTALAEILPALLARWAEGDDGVTIDFRFDRGDEMDGIAVRARPLESEGEWPEPTPENIRVVDPLAEIREMAEGAGSDLGPSSGKDYVH